MKANKICLLNFSQTDDVSIPLKNAKNEKKKQKKNEIFDSESSENIKRYILITCKRLQG